MQKPMGIRELHGDPTRPCHKITSDVGVLTILTRLAGCTPEAVSLREADSTTALRLANSVQPTTPGWRLLAIRSGADPEAPSARSWAFDIQH